MLLGAHVPAADPLAAARERQADVIQIFLSSPRQWAPPKPRANLAEIRDSPLPVYVHSPYLLNLAAADPTVRSRSRELLQATCDAAAEVGAAGVVVHGGQVTNGEEDAIGITRWVEALRRLRTSVPVLLEDTAGGPSAVARSADQLARLWETLDRLGVPFGLCLDTCHLHAAGEDLVAATTRLKDLLGRIDLVHLNDSRDAAGSGRDRHANLGDGEVDPDALVEAVRIAAAPTVVETPGGADGQAADLAWIRRRLSA
ncbi:MAG: deoxyribonuclease IV [Nitriliruptoraceae bacterium]